MGQCYGRGDRRPGDEESCPEKGGEKEVSITSYSVCKSCLCNYIYWLYCNTVDNECCSESKTLFAHVAAVTVLVKDKRVV